jgi:hypothetical protein
MLPMKLLVRHDRMMVSMPVERKTLHASSVGPKTTSHPFLLPTARAAFTSTRMRSQEGHTREIDYNLVVLAGNDAERYVNFSDTAMSSGPLSFTNKMSPGSGVCSKGISTPRLA